MGPFNTVVTFDIAGVGIFASEPSALILFLSDPRFNPGFEVALFDASLTGGAFSARFETATPVLDADMPAPTVLSSFAFGGLGDPLTISPSGGAGDLVINGIVSLGDTAQITAVPVPEPATWTLVGLGTLGVARHAGRRRKPRAA